MAEIWKDILYPGTYSVPDGKGGRRQVTFTRSDVAYHHQRLAEMIKADVLPPVAWEHQSTARPQTPAERDAQRAEKVKLTLGHATDTRLTPEGFLQAKLSVPNPADAARVPAIRYVSPEIDDDYEDGDGRKWAGPSILHIAVTARPVQHHQAPAKLSLLRLSLDRFAFGDDDMAGENETPDPKPKDAPEEKDAPPVAEGEGAKMSDVLAALAKVKIVLAPDTTPENLLDRLHSAVLTMDAHVNPEEETPDKPLETPTPVPNEAPMMMSLQKQLASEKARADKLQTRIGNEHRAALKDRAGKMLGFLDKPEIDTLCKQIDKQPIRLSLEGNVEPDDAERQIKAYEKAFQKLGGNPFGGLRLGQEQPEPVPRPESGNEPDHEIINRLTGGRYDDYKKKREAKGA